MVIHPIFHCVCRNLGNFFPQSLILFSQLQHSLEIANRFENGKFRKYPSPKSVGSWYRNLFMRDLVPRFSIRKSGDFPSNLPHVSSESFLQWPRCQFWGMIQPFQDNTESFPSPLGKITNMLWRKRWWPSRLSGFPFHSNSIRESLNLTGNPLGSIFWQAILNQDQIFKEDFTYSDSHSPSLTTEQCFVSSGKYVCILDKNILGQNFAQCAII